MTRREWLRLTAAAGGAALLPFRSRAVSAGRFQVYGRFRFKADAGWRFHLGHANDPAKDFGFGQGRVFDKVGRLFAQGAGGPARANFDDSTWQPVDLPHDWAVDLPFVNDPELNDFGYKPLGRNYPDTSIGWYRKVFEIPSSDDGRRLTLEFDGVFRNAMFVLNGHLLGTNFSGYAPARFDITDVVNYGGRNVLVVRVDATEREGWFYEGAGIYRHAWLTKTTPVYLNQDATVVTAELGRDSAVVTVTTEVINDTDERAVGLLSSFISSGNDDKNLPRHAWDKVEVGPRQSRSVTQQINFRRPKLWSPDQPNLYSVPTFFSMNGHPADTLFHPLGVRSVRFDSNQGLLLNGKSVKIKGTCNHQDHAGVGSALPDGLHTFRIATLKGMGCNAYRTAHNPPAPELLDACDRLGMFVLDETRLFSSNDEGRSQLERLIRRDRNHPCVIAWSIANEEWSDQAVDRGRRIADSLRRVAHELDPSRPVTAAMDSGYQNGKGISLAVDVQGFNYTRENIDAFHQQHPALPVMGTETASAYSTRGIYQTDKDKGYVSAYDVNKPDYAATAEQWWSFYAARPFLAGGFAWTGFDYRGEPSPYRWPCISSHFGILDTCGFPKDSFYYYKAWWTDEPVLHLFPHWNWAGKEGQDIDVWCFTNCDRVELFVNGTSAGAQDVKRNSHVAWKVPYVAGAIEARGTKAGGAPMTERRETTGPAAKIVVRPDRATIAADGEDVSVVICEIVDAQGRIVPTAGNEIVFTVDGPGKAIGVGNGDPSCHEADRGSKRSAFNGLCMVLVQATKESGPITVSAMSAGLETASAIVTVSPATPRLAI